MATETPSLTDYRPTVRQLEYVGAALAYLVAAVHIFHPQRGFPRLLLLVSTDNAALLASDPRPLLFVLSGLGILLAVKVVLLGYPRKPIYALGIALMGTFIVGYFGWHLTGHGGFLPGRTAHGHGLHPVETVLSHLRSYPVASASKLAEAALLAVLAVLYRHEGGADT